MKSFIQKLILYKYRFPRFSRSMLYQQWKKTYAKVACMMYDNPSKNMIIIGVTGTDGKTTTCNIIHHIINENLGKAALISTALIKIGNETAPNMYKMTSLDPFVLQRTLQLAKNAGCQYAILEVTSHSLHQNKFE